MAKKKKRKDQVANSTPSTPAMLPKPVLEIVQLTPPPTRSDVVAPTEDQEVPQHQEVEPESAQSEEPIPETQEPAQPEGVVNKRGERFVVGDQILVSAPWGKKAIAQIKNVYVAPSGGFWVEYSPLEPYPGWESWQSGCVRAELLVKANP